MALEKYSLHCQKYAWLAGWLLTAEVHRLIGHDCNLPGALFSSHGYRLTAVGMFFTCGGICPRLANLGPWLSFTGGLEQKEESVWDIGWCLMEGECLVIPTLGW